MEGVEGKIDGLEMFERGVNFELGKNSNGDTIDNLITAPLLIDNPTLGIVESFL